MLLRTRQQEFVTKCSAALQAEKNTLGIAPTGAGKTIMLAAVSLEAAPKELPSLILQHRDELVTQNRDKFIRFAGIRNIRRPMTIDGQNKAWDHQPGGWNFGMVQTVVKNLDRLPKLGMLGIDEAHHCAAKSYIDIIQRAKALNPDILIYGTTATPNRGDRKALRTTFSNVGDQIQIGELIQAGFLVKPRSFTLDIGVQGELSKVKRTAVDFDMKEVESIMNKTVINEKVVEHWMGFTASNGQVISCRNRQTIIFTSTTQHALDVVEAFRAHGISCEMISGDTSIMTLKERREVLQRYDAGHVQVLVNVSVLTEGFDHQPTSCVILLRPSSWKSTMTQMIGRGLRKVDPEEYPGVIKDDCIVLDFGTSLLTHGNLEDEPNLHGSGTKKCPECDAMVPLNSRECAICSYTFPDMFMPCPNSECRTDGYQTMVPITASTCKACGEVITERSTGEGGAIEKGIITNFVMTEIDILNDSPFKYESFYDGRVMLCFGFTHWAAVVNFQDGRFYAIGAENTNPDGKANFKMHCVASSDSYLIALQSADDFMRANSNKTDARRVAKWLYETATVNQQNILAEGISFGMTKYRASCAIQFKFYGNQIKGCINGFLNSQAQRISA